MKAIGNAIFAANVLGPAASLKKAFQRVSAADLAIPETWFRDAIFDRPELVIGPCRAAGLIPDDEEWLAWRKEAGFGSGPVDVLLVSTRGRVGLVETKLFSNPEKRREVVAQILEYAFALQDAPEEDLPQLPTGKGVPDADEVRECIKSGKLLLVVAGDELDPRAIRLSEKVLAQSLTLEWNLAMVDLNLFRSTAGPEQLLVVPEMRGMIMAEPRHVIKVELGRDGSRPRISSERAVSDTFASRQAKLTSEEEFLARVRQSSPAAESSVDRVLTHLRKLSTESDGRFTLGFQTASVNLYWNAGAQSPRILGLYDDGRFRVLLDYLSNAGHNDIASKVRSAAHPVVPIGPEERSGSIYVSESNVDQILAIIDATAMSVTQSAK